MEPRRTTALRWVASVAIVVLGVVTIVGIGASAASTAGKLIGALFVLLLLGGAGLRIWIASRPYGRADRSE